MRTLQQALFIALAIMFVAHQLLQKVWHIAIPWADHYLDPLLCMPIVLTLLLAERRHIFGKGDAYRLSRTEVIVAVGALSFLFEVLFPYWSDRFTADWWDVAAYAAGGGFFYFFLNRALPSAK